MKFKIGDIVKVLYEEGCPYSEWKGRTVKIVEICNEGRDDEHYGVQWEGGEIYWFGDHELEAVIEKEEPKIVNEDIVNSPKHYQLTDNFEVKDLMKLLLDRIENSDKMQMSHFQASCFKECVQYLLRCPLKNTWEDVYKAQFYLNEVIRLHEEEAN